MDGYLKQISVFRCAEQRMRLYGIWPVVVMATFEMEDLPDTTVALLLL